ncbi:class I SAM-dependent methyltransferase [Nitrococcus mobilis]|nr:class I SAM-dependent methyltransferase [Nitrococcus mobilis]
MKHLVSRFIAFITREVIREIHRLNGDREKPRMKIDMNALVNDLCSPQANASLQRFFAGNHRFIAMLSERNRRAAANTYDFIDEAMPHALFELNQMAVIASRSEDIMRLDGHILDLGVYKGSSTRNLAKIFPSRTIHGFDSFEGLPVDWSHALKGTFGDMKGIIPDMPANVKLYKGWFDETLPLWLAANRDKPISLLRVDCDIYSSTRTILTVFEPVIRPGTWIVFDELIGYRGFRDHELRAFKEFIERTGFKPNFVSYGLTYAMLYLE